MIREGKLTEDEGLELLETLQETDEEQPVRVKPSSPGKKSRLRIRVTDLWKNQIVPDY